MSNFVSDAILGQSGQAPPPVTSWEVSGAIDSLNPKATPGHDGLSMVIVKECYPVIKLHLLFILNVCLPPVFSWQLDNCQGGYHWKA